MNWMPRWIVSSSRSPACTTRSRTGTSGSSSTASPSRTITSTRSCPLPPCNSSTRSSTLRTSRDASSTRTASCRSKVQDTSFTTCHRAPTGAWCRWRRDRGGSIRSRSCSTSAEFEMLRAGAVARMQMLEAGDRRPVRRTPFADRSCDRAGTPVEQPALPGRRDRPTAQSPMADELRGRRHARRRRCLARDRRPHRRARPASATRCSIVSSAPACIATSSSRVRHRDGLQPLEPFVDRLRDGLADLADVDEPADRRDVGRRRPPVVRRTVLPRNAARAQPGRGCRSRRAQATALVAFARRLRTDRRAVPTARGRSARPDGGQHRRRRRHPRSAARVDVRRCPPRERARLRRHRGPGPRRRVGRRGRLDGGAPQRFVGAYAAATVAHVARTRRTTGRSKRPTTARPCCAVP